MKENEFARLARQAMNAQNRSEPRTIDAGVNALLAIADELHQLNEFLQAQAEQREHDQDAEDVRDLFRTQRDALI